MNKLIPFILLFGVTATSGQVVLRGNTSIESDKIQSDTINHSPNRSFEKRIKLPSINKSKSKIDIRLYIHHALSNTINLFRVCLTDQKWKAIEYEEWNNPVKINRYNLIPRKNFDTLFRYLVSNNLFTLPNQEELRKKYRQEVMESGDTMTRVIHVLDGYSYTIEFKVGDRFRIYSFDNPEEYGKYYDYITEFGCYTRIIQLFKGDLIRKTR